MSRPQERISRTLRAGIIFPVGRVERQLRKKVKERVGASAPVFLASVLEYLIAEVLEVAGNSAHQRAKKRIIPRNVMLGVHGDEELARLLRHVIIPGAGCVPSINPALLPSASRLRLSKDRRKKMEEADRKRYKAPSTEQRSGSEAPTKPSHVLRRVVPAEESQAATDEDDWTPPPAPPILHTPVARKTIPDNLWRRGSSLHKAAAGKRPSGVSGSPRLPEGEDGNDVAGNSSSDSDSSDNDGVSDDFHRQKRKEIKKRPAPKIVSLTEVGKRTEVSSRASKHETREDHANRDPSQTLYQHEELYPDVRELAFNGASVPGATVWSGPLSRHGHQSLDDLSSPDTRGNAQQSLALATPPAIPTSDKDSSGVSSGSPQKRHKSWRKAIRKIPRSSLFGDSTEHDIPSSDKESTDDSEIEQVLGKERSQTSTFGASNNQVGSLTHATGGRLAASPNVRSGSQSPGRSSKQRVLEHHRKRRKSAGSTSRLRNLAEADSSQESARALHADKAVSKQRQRLSFLPITRLRTPPALPDMDLSQTTQACFWTDDDSANFPQATEREMLSRPAPMILCEDSATSPRRSRNAEDAMLTEISGEDRAGTDGDNEGESDGEGSRESQAHQASPELEEVVSLSQRRREAERSAMSKPLPLSPLRPPLEERRRTLRLQSESTGLDLESQLERALYEAEQIADAVHREETFIPGSQVSTCTAPDSLIRSRRRSAGSSQPSSMPESKTHKPPTSTSTITLREDESDEEVRRWAECRRPPISTDTVASQRSLKDPKRVSTATVAVTFHEIIEISSGKEDVHTVNDEDRDLFFVKEERVDRSESLSRSR